VGVAYLLMLLLLLLGWAAQMLLLIVIDRVAINNAVRGAGVVSLKAKGVVVAHC
jgi:hypothetical protein